MEKREVKKTKVLVIIGRVNESHLLENFLIGPHKPDIDLRCLFLGSTPSILQTRIEEHGIKSEFIHQNGATLDLRTMVKLLRRLLMDRPKVVHTQSTIATLYGIPISFLLGIRKRIATRHHGNYNHILPEYKNGKHIDRIIGLLATDFIAPSKTVLETLHNLDHVPLRKIHLIHHGFDIASLAACSEIEVERIRTKYHLSQNFPIVGIVSRLVKWKSVDTILQEVKALEPLYPDLIVVVANADGPMADPTLKFLESNFPGRFRWITWEPEMMALFRTFDVFVHAPAIPEAEAFGQIYIEAWASNVPMVCSPAGIAIDFARDSENCLLVHPGNSGEITTAVRRLLVDQELRKKIAAGGRRTAEQFGIEQHVLLTDQLYMH